MIPSITKPIAVIGAMEEEIQILKGLIKNREDLVEHGIEFYKGTLNGKEIILLRSGIGVVNASIATTLLLSKFSPCAVINTGSAGGLSKHLAIGDIVISSDVKYHDVDVTVFGYEPGQVPGAPAGFAPDRRLIKIIDDKITIPGINIHHGLIVTGHAFLSTPEKVKYVTSTFTDAVAVEMEAAAVAHTCHQFKVPFIVARAISDIPENENPIDFKEFLETAAINSSDMVVRIIDHL